MRKVFRLFAVIVLTAVMAVTTSSCKKENKVTLKVYNWGDYIGEDVIDAFEEEYGIDVIYDTFTSNEEMLVKIEKGGGSYDVLFPSDYMIEKMIKKNMLHKIDFNNIPNYKYIDEKFKNLDYDPNNEYSVPYMWGTLGIVYNTKKVTETVDSWNILWDEKYKKEIFMYDSQRDSLAVALKKLGFSLNTQNIEELEAAKQELMKQKPLVLSYVGDDVKNSMIMGTGALAVVYSGDAVFMKGENPNLEYVVPKEGSNFFVDAMVIPANSKHKKEAELFINFMCRTDIAVKNVEYIGYSTPHTAAKELLDTELKNDEDAYPGDEILKRCEMFHDLGDFVKEYDRVWTEIMAK